MFCFCARKASISYFVSTMIDQLQNLCNFFKSLINKRQHQLFEVISTLDKELFRKIAFIENKLNTICQNVHDTHEIFFCMHEELCIENFGIIKDSERVKINDDGQNYRFFVAENGILCAKIEESYENDERNEQYSNIIMHWSHKKSGNRSELKIEPDKKNDKRIKIIVAGEKKLKVTFEKVCIKKRILEKYLNYKSCFFV